ncbi:MAG: hypothetical protein IJN56_06975 [Clostridia bacterium]|nr:hypothetical protein [Clostridia bacterium]
MAFTSTAAAEEILKAIKNGEYTNSSTVYGLLQQIINDCPGTAVAREAQQLLNERF